MTRPLVSIVVVSRGRPRDLRRCVLGLSQLFYHPFEVVIVADPAGRAAITDWSDRIKFVPFDQANISAARNAGLDAAAGQIIAFIDDDAVPEPSWLDHLIAPFADKTVDAAGGWVRGRNGISFQNKSRTVDGDGTHLQVNHLGPEPLVLRGTANAAPRTEGTNMAWRRQVLADLGGFNAAYRFFADETDLNMRLALRHGVTALVPLAQVHHGYGASAMRSADRVPLNLYEVGASWAVYVTRYAADTTRALAVARGGERSRMIHHAVRGNVWPGAVRKRLAEFDAGVAAGMQRPDAFWAAPPPPPFRPWSDAAPTRASVAIVSGLRHRRAAQDLARRHRVDGARVSLWRFSPTALYHHIRFDDAGVWLQTGGVFGRSDRQMPIFTPTRLQSRAASEVAKVSALREIAETHFIGA